MPEQLIRNGKTRNTKSRTPIYGTVLSDEISKPGRVKTQDTGHLQEVFQLNTGAQFLTSLVGDNFIQLLVISNALTSVFHFCLSCLPGFKSPQQASLINNQTNSIYLSTAHLTKMFATNFQNAYRVYNRKDIS